MLKSKDIPEIPVKQKLDAVQLLSTTLFKKLFKTLRQEAEKAEKTNSMEVLGLASICAATNILSSVLHSVVVTKEDRLAILDRAYADCKLNIEAYARAEQ